ncbi:head decoration protein [Pseudoalteromonas sp. Of7M-16]|uniref:head decoration protein n=1 Tax=Pseudoalteromonas sp. Of7M-16 TaxID=2917756 RepID=UPI001EF65566|nr:head decoration protein [Pseudoalteromonas sp. Of7M-16]MCG7551564.1 head decoration protein [Pseudoalteromonas sp. Of7M-16]
MGNEMLTRPGVHVAGELPGVSRDEIIVVGGAYLSGTVLGQLDNGTFTQLDVSAGATEANTAEVILYGHVDATAKAVPAVAHTRVCAVYEEKLIWPDAITDVQKADAVAKLAEKQVVLR